MYTAGSKGKLPHFAADSPSSPSNFGGDGKEVFPGVKSLVFLRACWRRAFVCHPNPLEYLSHSPLHCHRPGPPLYTCSSLHPLPGAYSLIPPPSDSPNERSRLAVSSWTCPYLSRPRQQLAWGSSRFTRVLHSGPFLPSDRSRLGGGLTVLPLP